MNRGLEAALLKTVAERMRHARALRGLSQVDVASRLGVLPSAVSRIERGRSGPSVRTLAELADVFETSTDYLLGRTAVFDG